MNPQRPFNPHPGLDPQGAEPSFGTPNVSRSSESPTRNQEHPRIPGGHDRGEDERRAHMDFCQHLQNACDQPLHLATVRLRQRAPIALNHTMLGPLTKDY